MVAYNPDEAKSELDAAGWKQDGDFRAKNGQQLKLNLLIPSGVATATSESALIQQQLKAIGVNVTISSLVTTSSTLAWLRASSTSPSSRGSAPVPDLVHAVDLRPG